MCCTILEVVRLHLIAMIVDLSPKVNQVNRHEDDSYVASIRPSELDIEVADGWNLEPAGIARDPQKILVTEPPSTPEDPCFGTTRRCVVDKANGRL